MTLSSFERTLKSLLLATMLFSFLNLNTAFADGGIYTGNNIYYADTDLEIQIFGIPDSPNFNILFWTDLNDIPVTGDNGNGSPFSVNSGIFNSYGTWTFIVIEEGADCSSLTFLNCQAETGYVGSNFFEFQEFRPSYYWILDLNELVILGFVAILPSLLFSIIGVVIILIGAGWAYSRIKKHMTGKKI